MDSSFTSLRQTSLAFLDKQYDLAARAAELDLDSLNRSAPRGLRFGSTDEASGLWQSAASGIATFLTFIGLISPGEALDALTRFYRRHPSRRGRSRASPAHDTRRVVNGTGNSERRTAQIPSDQSVRDLHRKALEWLTQEFEDAEWVSAVPVERLNELIRIGEYQGRDEILSSWLTNTMAIRNFAVTIGLISPLEARQLTASFSEQHPGLRVMVRTIDRYVSHWQSALSAGT